MGTVFICSYLESNYKIYLIKIGFVYGKHHDRLVDPKYGKGRTLKKQKQTKRDDHILLFLSM